MKTIKEKINEHNTSSTNSIFNEGFFDNVGANDTESVRVERFLVLQTLLYGIKKDKSKNVPAVTDLFGQKLNEYDYVLCPINEFPHYRLGIVTKLSEKDPTLVIKTLSKFFTDRWRDPDTVIDNYKKEIRNFVSKAPEPNFYNKSLFGSLSDHKPSQCIKITEKQLLNFIKKES